MLTEHMVSDIAGCICVIVFFGFFAFLAYLGTKE